MPPKSTSDSKAISRDLVTLVFASIIQKQGNATVDHKFMSALSTLLGDERERTESSLEHELRGVKQDASNLVKRANELEKAGNAIAPVCPKTKGAGIAPVKAAQIVQSKKRKRGDTEDEDNDISLPTARRSKNFPKNHQV